MGRGAAILVTLAVVLTAGAPAGAAAPPCAMDAALCAPADADGSCTAVGLWSTGGEDRAHSETSLEGTTADEQDYERASEAGVGHRLILPSSLPPEVRLDVTIDSQVVESYCGTYTYDANAHIKSCGGARVSDLMLSILRPADPRIVRIWIEEIVFGVCIGAQPDPSPPSFDMRFGHAEVQIGSDTTTLHLDANAFTVPVIEAGGLAIGLNERYVETLANGCGVASGAALRIVDGDAQTVIASTAVMACRIAPAV